MLHFDARKRCRPLDGNERDMLAAPVLRLDERTAIRSHDVPGSVAQIHRAEANDDGVKVRSKRTRHATRGAPELGGRE